MALSNSMLFPIGLGIATTPILVELLKYIIMKLIKRNELQLSKTNRNREFFGNNPMFDMDELLYSGVIYEVEKSDFDEQILTCGSHSSMPYIQFIQEGDEKGFRIFSLNGFLQEKAEWMIDGEPTYFCKVDDIDYVYRVVEWVKNKFTNYSSLVTCRYE